MGERPEDGIADEDAEKRRDGADAEYRRRVVVRGQAIGVTHRGETDDGENRPHESRRHRQRHHVEGFPDDAKGRK
jgi:hypothetical protein